MPKHLAHWLPLAMVLLALQLSACADLGPKPGKLNVSSEPAGAEIWVMGSKVGETPLELDQDQVFPLTYPSDKKALYGLVELRKAGCASSVLTVSARRVERGIKAKLDCAGVAAAKGVPQVAAAAAPVPATPAQASVAAPAAQPPVEAAKPIVVEGASTEIRLRRVIELRDKGVISEQEAREIRQRILGEL